LRAAPDGHAEFFVLLAAQPDLSAAYAIADWRARGQWVVETMQKAAKAAQGPIVKSLEGRKLSAHVDRWQSFWIVNAIAVRGDALAAKALAGQPGVAHILPAVKLEAPKILPASRPDELAPTVVEWNVEQINADDVWSLGYTGAGMTVANVDTGVELTHPALVNQYRGNQGSDATGPFVHDYNWFDSYWNSREPTALSHTATSSSPNFHGTHVMGTEAGADGGDNQIGVAPGARWIAAFGCCIDNASLLAALQWMAAPTRLDGSDPNPDMRPHVVQNSWGGPGGSLIFNQAATTLVAAGIFVSASAGNNGGYGCGSLGSPGDNPALFNVGASNSAGSVAFLSSRGPDPFSGRTGPDLIAPGQGVRSAWGNGTYTYSSGTSMAGPHVAGAVALLWDANPALLGRVDYTAELLRKTAQPVYLSGESCGGVDSGSEHPNNSAGWGLLDALRAVQVAGNGDSRVIVHTVDDAGQPVAGAVARISVAAPDGRLVNLEGVTAADGSYEFLVAPGAIGAEATMFGYAASGISATVPNSGALSLSLTLTSLPRHTLHGLVAEQASHQLHLPLVASHGATAVAATQDLTPQSSERQATTAVAHTKPLSARVSLPDSPLSPVMTDCTGAFSMTLPTGQHTLLVEAPGYAPQEISVSVAEETTQIMFLQPVHDYAVSDSRNGEVVFDWIDATAGTRHQLSDESSKRIDLPEGRSFTYYGATYEELYISSNGFAIFGFPFSLFHGIVPFEGLPNNAIYAYAEDLNPGAGAQYGTGFDNGIYTLQNGERLIIQYNEVEHWAQGDPETFQLILDLTTGEISMQYQHVSWPDFTTVALEDTTGGRGVSYSYANSADLQAGLAVRFRPIYGQPEQSCTP
jgi:subtilisin family serine protease